MPESELRLLKRAAIHWERAERNHMPNKIGGIYFLYQKDGDFLNVVYVGIARGQDSGIKGRLRAHHREKLDWTHFSAYEVHDNIKKPEVEELEALFRTAYAKDEHANNLNMQRGNKKLNKIRVRPKDHWPS